MAQMQTVSIRIPDEDFQWLLSRHESGARTPSEKLRALLARTRQQETGLSSPEACSAWVRSLMQPLVDEIGAHERKHRCHSDLIAAVAESVPQIMATLMAFRLSEEHAIEDATEAEAALARQCFRLLTMMLRLAVTSVPTTYDKNVLDGYLQDIIELADIISTRKGKESNHG